MERIDIVMVTWNRLDFTKQCLKFLKERTKTPYRLIVVDNNSDDGSQKWLYEEKLKGNVHHLILLERNYGIHMAKNYGMALVRPSKYYIDTDNDLLCADLKPDWIQQLVDLMDKNKDYGAIACRPQVLVGDGPDKFDTEEAVVAFSHVGGHLRIHRTEETKKFGWAQTWDAKRNNEDRHIASNLKEQGLKTGYARNVRCWHMFGENWGYKDVKPEDHGHNPVWPPPEHFDTIIDKFDSKTWETITQ